ncbi:secretion protein HlyD [Alcanivorax balearicus MACL04]|uniref:Secretion protein HlyD n=2 Tax=Alloalcanivorax balearicus TaxID=413232 RepID=A0ABT2R468_9GAMM|nr:efflux RND transporter periplasmic adaptor subunit [Alloalcanivorax balearicus]MCU5784497.1 secretion protein HlyD [Alloalcanivorax balearicus MACL04]
MDSINTHYASGGELIIGLALILMVAVGLAGCDARGEQEQAQMPPPAVKVAKVLDDPVMLWDDFTGRVAAPETVDLRPRVSGYIDKVSFEEGELVEQGDVLFVIDQRPYRARERAAAADLAQARSQYQLAKSEASRAERLVASRAISREEYDRRASAMVSARAAMNAAEAALETARLDLEYTEVRSPITGRAGRAMVTRGNLANADQTLLTTLVSVDPVYVYFESDSDSYLRGRELLGNGEGTEVRIGLSGENGYPHRGKVDFIDNRLNASTGTLQFRAVVPNPDGRFKPGQFARVELPAERLDTALLIDSKALLTDQNRRYVYVVDDENKASRRNVDAGRTVDGLVVIRDGLKPGERVIVNGVQKVFMSGMPVAPTLVEMRAAATKEPEVAATP